MLSKVCLEPVADLALAAYGCGSCKAAGWHATLLKLVCPVCPPVPYLPSSSVCLAPPAPPLQFGAGAAMADQRALDILGEAYCK